MYAEERQQAIAMLAQERGRVGVADLARRFNVTPETVRRDLDSLAAAGTIVALRSITSWRCAPWGCASAASSLATCCRTP